MPLYTTDIEAAKVAYATLETRATAAESYAATLQARVAQLESLQTTAVQERQSLAQRYLETVVANMDLNHQIVATPPDITLSAFIAHLGTAAAIAEAAMPDRAIPSLAASVSGWLVVDGGDVGLRFHRPDDPTGGFATTTVETNKVPTPANAPPRLISVLQTKMAVYGGAFFASIVPAHDAIVAASDAVSRAWTWTFAALIATATRIATLEESIAASLPASTDASAAAAYRSATAQTAATVAALAQRAIPVSADVLALAAALNATTASASALT